MSTQPTEDDDPNTRLRPNLLGLCLSIPAWAVALTAVAWLMREPSAPTLWAGGAMIAVARELQRIVSLLLIRWGLQLAPPEELLSEPKVRELIDTAIDRRLDARGL